MRRAFHLSCCLLLAGLASGCGSLAKFDVIQTLTNGRDGWQHPEAVIKALAIAPGDVVAGRPSATSASAAFSPSTRYTVSCPCR